MTKKLDGTDATILALIRQSEVCPSYEDIGNALGKKKTMVKERIYKLVKLGLIEREKGANRALTVTEKGMEVLPELVLAVKEGDVLKKFCAY